MRYFSKREYNDLVTAREKKAMRRKAVRLEEGASQRLIKMESVSEVEKYTVARDADTALGFNKAIEKWEESVLSQLRASVMSRSKRVAKELKVRSYKDEYGLINRIGFSFPRHGVYIHYGAGRGQGGFTGSSWTKLKKINGVEVSTGIVRHTNPASLDGSMGSHPRKAHRWFDSVVSNRLPELMNIVTEYFDTMIVDASRIYIEK